MPLTKSLVLIFAILMGLVLSGKLGNQKLSEKDIVESAFSDVHLFLKPRKNDNSYESRGWTDVYKAFPDKSWGQGRGKNYWDTNEVKEANLSGPFYIAFAMHDSGRPNSYIYGIDLYSEGEFPAWVLEYFHTKFKPLKLFCNANSDTKLFIIKRSENVYSLVEYNPTSKGNPIIGGVNPVTNNLYFYFDGFSSVENKMRQLNKLGFFECK